MYEKKADHDHDHDHDHGLTGYVRPGWQPSLSCLVSTLPRPNRPQELELCDIAWVPKRMPKDAHCLSEPSGSSYKALQVMR